MIKMPFLCNSAVRGRLPMRFFLILNLLICFTGCANDPTPFDDPALAKGEKVDFSRECFLTKVVAEACKKNDRGEYEYSQSLEPAKYKNKINYTNDKKQLVEAEVGQAHAGGCINRNIKNLWQISTSYRFVNWINPKISLEKENFKLLRSNLEDGSLFLFWTKYDHLRFWHTEMEWKHYLREGTVNAPRHVYVNYLRTKGDTTYWNGSIELKYESPDTTTVKFVDRLKALEGNLEESAKTSVQQLFNHLKNSNEINEEYIK
jgi:hypothetical protein